MVPHRCPGRIRRVPGAYRFWALFAFLTLAPSTAFRTLAATASLQIPVKAIGALPLTAVMVDYLRDDRTVARQLPNVPLSDGLLRIATVPGSSELRISAEGFEPVEVSVANASLGVSLPALSHLTVKWPFRIPSKIPPSVDLYLVPRKGRPPSSKKAVLVPGTDTFSALVAPGFFTVLLHYPGAGLAASAQREFHPGALERVDKFVDLPSRDLLLRVTDADGRPLPTAYVRFECEGTPSAETTVGSWLSGRTWRPDSEGRIELRSIPVSACSASLTSKGFRRAALKPGLERVTGPAVFQTVALRPLTRLNLEVDRSLLGKEDAAEVSLILSETEADAEPQAQAPAPGPRKVWSGVVRGRECIRGLEGGVYRAWARVGVRMAGEEFVLSASPDAPDERTIRIRFEPRRVRGRVFLGESPGRHISVEALANDRTIRLEDEPLASTTTDEDGSFEMPVSYGGSLILRARLGEANLVYQEVDAQWDTDKEVILRGWASSIVVRAFDAASGEPVTDATLEVTELLNDGRRSTSTRAVPGEMTLTGLGPGQLKLRVSSPRHRLEEKTLAFRGDEEGLPLDFALTPKIAAAIVLTGEGGEPIADCSVLSSSSMTNLSPQHPTFLQVGQTDWSGRVVLDDVGAGSVLVFIRPGYSLQLTPASALPSDAGGDPQPFSVTLASLREKLTIGTADQLAQRLSGPPTFAAYGFVVPHGLARYLAVQSGLSDESLLLPGQGALLMWSRLLSPGQYTVFSTPVTSALSDDAKGKEASNRSNATTITLN